MKRALFIFRRDLRLNDNLGLISALESAEEVVLAFIFTPEQIEHNPYKSPRCLQFMIESLEDLENQIAQHNGRLYLFYDSPDKVIETCLENLKVEGVFLNADYTPYSVKRDKKIAAICHKKGVLFKSCHDLLLHNVDETVKSDGSPYTVFTPFFKNASKLPVPKPQALPGYRFYNKPLPFSQDRSIFAKILPKRENQAPGGRLAAKKIIQNLKTFAKYPIEKDLPALDKTTHLSPHLKFTTYSIREVYNEISLSLGPQSELIRALFWRDFFTQIAFHFPHVFKGAFQAKYDHLPWKNDRSTFERWCEGKTGFPIVDAGMRELNQTGYMHNRVRMITASFLVKDLHIHWQWGEKYFATHLIDYDPAVNNGNWQWSASTGCDAQPYFRIFNPWLQASKFDPTAEYIKNWVPELSLLSPKVIHEWYLEKHHPFCPSYPPPMIEHATEAHISLQAYKKIKGEDHRSQN